VVTATQETRPEGGGPPVETSGHAPGTPKVEPGAGKATGEGNVSDDGKPEDLRPDPAATDSHMVVGKDARREEMVQKYVDKLNEISMEMYLESKSSGPPPIPMLGPKESKYFFKQLEDFKLTPEQIEFYRDARRRFPPEQPRRKLLKHRRRYAVRESGGMIRMPGNKPEPPEPEEESFFEVDDEVHGPVAPKVKAEPELQKPVPKVERPDEIEEEEELEDEDEVTLIDDMETMSMRAGDPEAMGYVVDLLIQTDEDNDHSAILTIDNITIEIMLGDFIEIVEALERMLPRMRDIQSS
jgi:hypothetical protein